MPKEKFGYADALFIIQVVCTIAFGGMQFLSLLEGKATFGMSWYALWLLFVLVNLWLAYKADQAQRSRGTIQTLGAYALWGAVILADLGVLVAKGTKGWNGDDTNTVTVAAVCIAITLAVAHVRGLGIADPIVKGHLALWFKAVPQLFLAYTIFRLGNAGVTLTALIAGHITVCTRLGQLIHLIRRAGWDRNRRGSAISEVGNELSWVAVTIAWVF